MPWENAYRTAQVLGGRPRFVLSTSGHIQAIVNPPSDKSRSTYRIADEHPADPAEWEANAAAFMGSWWPDYEGWLAERSGNPIDAPRQPGSAAHPPLEAAPGRYVHEQ